MLLIKQYQNQVMVLSYSLNYCILLSATIPTTINATTRTTTTRTSTTTTTTVTATTCQIEYGIDYVGHDVNNGSLDHPDWKSCQSFCFSNYPSASYFVYAPIPISDCYEYDTERYGIQLWLFSHSHKTN